MIATSNILFGLCFVALAVMSLVDCFGKYRITRVKGRIKEMNVFPLGIGWVLTVKNQINGEHVKIVVPRHVFVRYSVGDFFDEE
ncbi:MAG: hypothetical protein ACRDDY_04240 [Clostridium sp.]|uniref:hypothetical protein n=1 Tax=Clostridium sp. TaxID=1506 RepID=UPI003EE61165